MSQAKVRLGRYLFYDKRLSVWKRVLRVMSQAGTRVHRRAGEGDRSYGRLAPRSAMSLVNVANGASLTWSNPQLSTLEQQALIPMYSDYPIEPGVKGRDREVAGLLRSDMLYHGLFAEAFSEDDPYTIQNTVKALAAF